MSFAERLGWSAIQIAAGLGAGYAAHSFGAGLFTALVWCAVAAGFFGYVEGDLS